MDLLSKGYRSGLGIDKFVAEIIAGIKPGLNSFRLVARSFFEVDYGFADWF